MNAKTALKWIRNFQIWYLQKNHPSLKTEKEIEGLRLNIKCCEKVIKQQKEKQKILQTTIKDKEADHRGYHTLEYIEEKFEKKLESFRDQMTNAIKDNCSNAVKSYAAVAKPDVVASVKSTVETVNDLQKAIKNA